MNQPETFSNFYTKEKLGFDLRLVEYGFNTFKPFFKGKTCLELGPATGYMSKLLYPCFEQLVVVEGSKTLIDQIPNYDNIEKINCLFENFNPNCKFNTIIINHVLEHIFDPISLLVNVYNWLENEGVCIIGVPNAKSFHRLAAVKMGLLKTEFELNERDIELGHYRVYDLDTLKLHVEAANFKIKSEGGIFVKFLSNNQIENYLSDEVIKAYFELGQDFYLNSAEIFLVLTK
jgi:2-polyprenyl-3-methyl-5-hydroxy-6-metoxy-1,4-benzoquinol methylase